MSPPLAHHLASHHVVTGFPDQRLAYLSEDIRKLRAQYCAVIQPKSFVLVGLIRFSEVAANPSSAMRILADVMHSPPPRVVLRDDPVERVMEILREHDPEEVVVTTKAATFVGLITPESIVRWALASGTNLDLSRLPVTSRWNPRRPQNGA